VWRAYNAPMKAERHGDWRETAAARGRAKRAGTTFARGTGTRLPRSGSESSLRLLRGCAGHNILRRGETDGETPPPGFSEEQNEQFRFARAITMPRMVSPASRERRDEATPPTFRRFEWELPPLAFGFAGQVAGRCPAKRSEGGRGYPESENNLQPIIEQRQWLTSCRPEHRRGSQLPLPPALSPTSSGRGGNLVRTALRPQGAWFCERHIAMNAAALR